KAAEKSAIKISDCLVALRSEGEHCRLNGKIKRGVRFLNTHEDVSYQLFREPSEGYFKSFTVSIPDVKRKRARVPGYKFRFVDTKFTSDSIEDIGGRCQMLHFLPHDSFQ